MRHSAPLFLSVLVAVAACKSEQTIRQTDARIEVNPVLVDFGTVAVGAPMTGLLEVDHLAGGDVVLRNITVTNAEGEWFSYEGEEELILDRGGQLELELTYLPQDEGYHRAEVRVTHTGKDSPAIVDIRGRAVVAQATISPLALDFGPVPVGGTSTEDVVVTNDGNVPLLVGDADLSNPAFSVDSALPIEVDAGSERVITLRFDPDDDQAEVGTVTLRAGEVALPRVSLRGNDCENGLPEAYDVDGDGVTTCGGDCDDGDDTVQPGAPELVDGIDNDCDADGAIDEGTIAADDDGDGYCEDTSCTDGSLPGDCNDGDGAVSPGDAEIPNNGIDDDCDGIVDSGTSDLDFDGYDPLLGGDCDDADPTVYPGAPELEDMLDNDCDGDIDEGTSWVDNDGDGYCAATVCGDGSTPGDCDDGDPDTWPGAPELPDWRDNNCDAMGLVDEGTVNADDDGDGYTETGGDCDDTDPAMSPALGTC